MNKYWHEGTIGVPKKDGSTTIVHYWVKAFEEGSEYGINGGRISKLTMKADGEYIANYDRDWDIEPDLENETTAVAYFILLDQYN